MFRSPVPSVTIIHLQRREKKLEVADTRSRLRTQSADVAPQTLPSRFPSLRPLLRASLPLELQTRICPHPARWEQGASATDRVAEKMKAFGREESPLCTATARWPTMPPCCRRVSAASRPPSRGDPWDPPSCPRERRSPLAWPRGPGSLPPRGRRGQGQPRPRARAAREAQVGCPEVQGSRCGGVERSRRANEGPRHPPRRNAGSAAREQQQQGGCVPIRFIQNIAIKLHRRAPSRHAASSFHCNLRSMSPYDQKTRQRNNKKQGTQQTNPGAAATSQGRDARKGIPLPGS